MYDPATYMDPCVHLEHLVQNGEMISKEEWTVKGLLPLASLNTVMSSLSEILHRTARRRNREYLLDCFFARVQDDEDEIGECREGEEGKREEGSGTRNG